MHTFDLIYLDLDGPILDTQARHHAVLTRVAPRGALLPDASTLWRHKRGGGNTRSFVEQFAPHLDADAIAAAWRTSIEDESFLQLDVLQPDAATWLHQQRRRGARLRLITARSNREALHRQLERLHLAAYFERVIVCSPDAGLDAKVVPLRDDAPTGNACLIGDSEIDMHAARAVGLTALAVACGVRDKDALLRAGAQRCEAYLADYVVGSMQHHFRGNAA